MKSLARHFVYGQHTHALIVALLLGCFATPSVASLPDFTELVGETSESVVNISALHNSSAQDGKSGSSVGSGFVIAIGDRKYIITNNHVTEGADELLVRFNDRVELLAKQIGADKLTDVALLEIIDLDGKELKEVVIGDSETLKAGQWAVAIGSPFSFDYSVTAGIISALGRSLPGESYVPFIQSDVAVNQGNSGGPLFNLEGEVIGINSRIFSRTGNYAGLSFSIPIHIAVNVAQQLKEKGAVTRGFLGVSVSDVTRELIKPFGLKKAQGALVVEVFKGDAADKGGILTGDIIIEYEGKEIVYSGDLPVLVGRTEPGTERTFVILRQGKRKTLTFAIGNRDEAGSNRTNKIDLGMQLIPLTDEQLASISIDSGVAIQSVKNNGLAFQSGFQTGDIITHFYQTPVSSIQGFFDLVEKAKTGTHVPLRILRDQRRPIYIALQIP